MTTFKDLELKPELQKALAELSFEEPTPIQAQVIPLLLQNQQDIIGLAQTGTGKTAAFGLPVLQRLNPGENKIQALILSPTRELAQQIAGDLDSFSRYLPKTGLVPVFGGASIADQIKRIKAGGRLIVGTPGRVLDLIRRKALSLAGLRYLVLDEADAMLDLGFKQELEDILQNAPDDRRTLLFSATMPTAIRRIAEQYMRSPVEIAVGRRNSGAENVEHIFYQVLAKDRYLALKRLLDINPDIYGIVFCRTRRETKEVAEKLSSDGYNADALHGDLTQAQRDYVMRRFHTRGLQILTATDVAARGLHVDDLSHVINYNLPDDAEIYVHRSGRTGRVNKHGLSLSLIGAREKGRLKDMERFSGKRFRRENIPGGREICEKQLYHLIARLVKADINHAEIEPYLPEIENRLADLDRQEIIKKFVSLEFNRFIDYYRDAQDLNHKKEDPKTRKAGDRKMVWLVFGKPGNANLSVPDVLRGLDKLAGDQQRLPVGKVDFKKPGVWIEVNQATAALLAKKLTVDRPIGPGLRFKKIAKFVPDSAGPVSKPWNSKAPFRPHRKKRKRPF